jgi:hypothetical protein
MRIRLQLFTEMLIMIPLLTLIIRIKILLLVKVMKSATTGLQTLQGSSVSLQASIVSVDFEPLKPLNFDCNADPDPAFLSNGDPDPDPAFQNNA